MRTTKVQSDQPLCYSLLRQYNASSFYIKNFKTLAGFCSWAGRFDFDLVRFLFYRPSTHFRSFRARSVTLTTLFRGKPPSSLPVLIAHSFTSNWQLLFLNQRKRENGRRNVFMTKSSLGGSNSGAACMPSGLASDRATASGTRPVWVYPGRKPRRQVFSWWGSNKSIRIITVGKLHLEL